MKLSVLSAAVGGLVLPSATSFVPNNHKHSSRKAFHVASTDIEINTKKPTGTSFLPEETLERAKAGSPIEKVKLEKDPVSAFVDVYEYARKIREGEMTWEEVEKADLDSVSSGSLHKVLSVSITTDLVFTLTMRERCLV
jgi:hypothetical protein